MSAERVAYYLCDLVDDDALATAVDGPARHGGSDGWFFDATVNGKHYEVLVTELTRP